MLDNTIHFSAEGEEDGWLETNMEELGAGYLAVSVEDEWLWLRKVS